MIVCWEHDWPNCSVEVIELKTEIQGMKNWPIKHPNTTVEKGRGGKDALQQLFINMNVQPLVQDWYHQIESALRTWDAEIWTNVGKKYIGFYSPEKSFASLSPKPNSIQIEYFSRGQPLEGTHVTHATYSPRWAKFSIKQADQVALASATLKEACTRLKAAIHAGEPTGYFSGGVKPATTDDAADDVDEQDLNEGDAEVGFNAMSGK